MSFSYQSSKAQPRIPFSLKAKLRRSREAQEREQHSRSKRPTPEEFQELWRRRLGEKPDQE